MYPKLVWERLLGILFYPKQEWKSVRKQREIAPESLLLLLVCCLCLGFSAQYSMGVNWYVYAFIPFLTLLISSVIVRMALPKQRKQSWEKGLSLVIYPNVPSLILLSICMLIGYRKYLIPLCVTIMLVYTFLGIIYLFNLSKKESLYMLAIYALVYFLCFFFMLVLLSN